MPSNLRCRNELWSRKEDVVKNVSRLIKCDSDALIVNDALKPMSIIAREHDRIMISKEWRKKQRQT